LFVTSTLFHFSIELNVNGLVDVFALISFSEVPADVRFFCLYPIYIDSTVAGIVFRFFGFYLDVFVGAVLFLSFCLNA
jgi:hypothetical protein